MTSPFSRTDPLFPKISISAGLLGLCFIIFSCQNTQEAASTAPYKAVLQKGIDQGFPAYVLGVQKESLKPWIGAKGLASIEESRKVKATDRFPIASITKLFTAVTTLKLIDQGLLSLEDKVLKHLSQAEVKAIPYIESISIRQLLDHSSGIYAFNNDEAYIPTLIGPERAGNIQWTPQMFLALADSNRVAPLGKPGSGHYYGDTNYILLGLIIEKVSGQSFRKVVEKEILDVLDLRNTAYISDENHPKKVELRPDVEGYTLKSEILGTIIPMYEGFNIVNDSLYNTTEASERIDASAGMVSNAEELMKLATAVYKDNFLSAESTAFLLEAGNGIDSLAVGEDRQGIVRAMNTSFGKIYFSSGDGPGVNTLLAFIPEKDLIIVSLTNMFGQFEEEEFVLEKIIPGIVAINDEGN